MGEVVVPSAAAYDPDVHLSKADVKVNSRSKLSYIEVRIKASKTDVFRKGVTVYLGATGNDLCPVAAVFSYMVSSPKSAAKDVHPFFCFSNNQPLMRERFVKELQSALQSRGIAASAYMEYSFRIGAATTAMARGILDSLIKTLWWWESAAYMVYIRTPQSTLCAVAKQLVDKTESL